MAITDKTRKQLWGQSGSRCAICREALVKPETQQDEAAIVGDECHIISRQANGPRSHIKLADDMYDQISNLLLLCKVHHKQVDDQPNEFTIEKLRTIKAKHEEWVNDSLSTSDQTQQLYRFTRLRSGKELREMSITSLGYLYDYGDISDERELNAISSFQQKVHDLREFWDDLEVTVRVEAEFEISSEIENLNSMGFWVFGQQIEQTFGIEPHRQTVLCFYMLVIRKGHPGITPSGEFLALVK